MSLTPTAARRAHPWLNSVVAVSVLAVTAAVILTIHQLGDRSADLAPGPERSPAPLPATAVLNPTDIAFIELMIPMNERALPLFDLLGGGGGPASPALREVLAVLAAAYPAEVVSLRAALSAGGAVEQNLHAGMDMPGFVTQSQLDQLGAVSAGERDSMARDVLCPHLRQSVLVARAELNAGSDPATQDIATAMLDVRLAPMSALDCPQP